MGTSHFFITMTTQTIFNNYLFILANNQEKDTIMTAIKDIILFINKRFNQYFPEGDNFKYYHNSDDLYFVCDLDKSILNQCSKKHFTDKLLDKCVNDIRKTVGLRPSNLTINKVVMYKNNTLLIRSRKVFKAEVLEWFPNPLAMFNSLNVQVERVKTFASKALEAATNSNVKLLMLDLFNFILQVREGYFTPTKFLSTFISVMTLSSRANDIIARNAFFAEALELSINDIIMAFSILGLPSKLMDKLKTFMLLSGKKIQDCSALMSMLSSLFEILISVIDQMIIKYPITTFLSPVADILRSILSYFIINAQVKEVTVLYTKFMKDPQIMFDPLYRESVKQLYQKAKENPIFLTYVNDANNKHANILWKAFEINVVKYANTYETSARQEPICIVLEGPPGSGKTMLMNQLVELLRAANHSVYVHTCPAIDAAKDFYDDYNDQEVFVSDDMGQQGVSQWRSVINFVSPVRYPLDCAAAEKKNTKFFKSNILIMTTNQFEHLHGFTKSDCIAEPEALFRRVHLIKVSRNADITGFYQDVQYKKFDHIVHKRWINGFIGVHSDVELNPTIEHVNPLQSLKWLYEVLLSLKVCEARNLTQMTVSEEQYTQVLLDAKPRIKNIVPVNEFYDPVYEPQMLMNISWHGLFNGFLLTQEWLQAVINSISAFLTNHYTESALLFAGSFTNASVLSVIVGSLCSVLIGKFLYDSFITKVDVNQSMTEEWRKKFATFNDNFAKFKSESGISDDIPTYVENLTKHSRMLVSLNKDGIEDVTHAIVSGNYLIMPAHTQWSKRYVDIYQSWDHYDAKHVECEQVQITLVKEYMTVDIAIYRFEQLASLYKKCNSLFKPSLTRDPFLYLISGRNCLKLLRGSHVSRNVDVVSYVGKGEYINHPPETGLVTPVSSPGLCGAFLVDTSGSIVGMHVAGNGDKGFAVCPNDIISDDIRNIILNTTECEFDVCNKVIPNFSGVRLRYKKGEVDKKYPIGKTNFRPSPLHVEYNAQMDELLTGLESLGLTISEKRPPLIDKPIAKLEEMAHKSFAHQGQITDEEELHLANVLDDLIPNFEEVTWDEAVFGNDVIPALNKDSSNGYGMLPNKKDYIDYENKLLLPSFEKAMDDFKKHCEKGKVKVTDVLCVETFKDELRTIDKVFTPRTFRVMPLQHIAWTKKICANLIAHFKENMHKTGVCVGFNPYLDFETVHKKLIQCEVVCDIDFKKWDGTLMARIMKIISRTFAAKYTGENHIVLYELMQSTYNSTVLVYDAVYRTNHGMPSGTWLTLLLNCLYNKCITALTLYRHGFTSVKDVYEVVDYVMGDDKLCGADKKYAKAFNAITIERVAASLGMHCTNGDKSKIASASCHMDKINFLKRTFVYDENINRWMGKLSLETILNTIQWYDVTKDFNETMEGKCKAMQIEIYLHGDVIYKHYMKVVRDTFPHFRFFEMHEILDILSQGEYSRVCAMSGKDISFTNA